MIKDDQARARALIQAAQSVVITTGAGISAESGVPTFRGAGGLWKKHRPEDLATPGAFARDSLLVWEWYGWRRGLIAACEPNAAHFAVACFVRDEPNVTLVTQNVDGLHSLAATLVSREGEAKPPRPLTLHGDIFINRCLECGASRESRDAIDATSLATLPHCPDCGGLERPGVVWFGEALPSDTLELAMERAAAADVCLVVGTSNVVYPAAAVPLSTLQGGGAVIEVNPDRTALSPQATLSLRAGAARMLPVLLDPRGGAES